MAPSLMARWMLEVEEQLNRLLAPAHFHRLATDHGRERGQSLLTVEQKPRALVGVPVLCDGELLQRDGLVSLPE
jgi:hypothetical protein